MPPFVAASVLRRSKATAQLLKFYKEPTASFCIGPIIELSMQEISDFRYTETEDELSVGRRGFLVAGIYGLVSVIAGSLGITAALYVLRGPKPKQGAGWADAGDISALPAGVPRRVTFVRTRIDGWKISNQKDTAWLLNNADGSFIAFSPLCTHLGCAYQWQLSGGAFVCPCHGSSFSRTGDVITGPANRPLDRYQVKREGTRIWLGPIVKARNPNA